MSDQAGYVIDTGPQSLGEILGNVVRDIQDLLRSEVRLAKTEVSEQVERGKTAGALFGAAAVMGLLAGMCLIATCIAALSLTMEVWLAALIMTLVIGAGATFMYMHAKTRLRGVHAAPQHTIQTVRDDIQWLKQRTR
jgi:Flp pilus assembly protein TadB